MKQARYLLRFDDVCPTMNWDVWTAIERALNEAGVRPLLAVVPDNQDPNLVVGSPDPLFWGRVRHWQSNGWTIALHGYQHLYSTVNAGLLRLHPGSEFAGVPREEQAAKLRNGLNVFARERIVPEVWVAPGHSFDSLTLSLLRDFGLRVVSDGLSLFPFTDVHGLTWIPQQLWSLRRRPFGVWTVCHHINEMGAQDLQDFTARLHRFQTRITSVPELLREFTGRRQTGVDWATSQVLYRSLLVRRRLRSAFRARHGSVPSPAS